MINTRRMIAYEAPGFGFLVPVQIHKQQRNHHACAWNQAIKRWHGKDGKLSPRVKQAHLDGIVARMSGKPMTDNPHPLNTNLSNYWSKGWRKADTEVTDNAR